MWEFGSGFSTPWFAQRVEHIWTMDNAEYWTRAAKNACDRKELKNVTFYCENRGGKYETKIEDYPDKFFDFILVDGRDRVKCFMNAFPKVSRVIALDNGLREWYAPVREFMETQEDWDLVLSPWVEQVVRDGKVIPIVDSWHCLVWVKKIDQGE